MAKYITLTPELYSYVETHRSSAPNDALLAALRRETEAMGDISQMLISAEQGTFLSLLIGVSGAKRAVEVGTFTGYSALQIAAALPPGGRLWCFDQSDEWTNTGRRYWERAGLDDRIELTLGDARRSLAYWQPDGPIDFAFIDADKTGYDTYYELLLPRMRSNGLLVFDNVLRNGRITAPESDDDRAIAVLNDKIRADTRVEAVVLTLADGLLLCRKK
jgi:caffeoyl-CoA O-methyltransferase